MFKPFKKLAKKDAKAGGFAGKPKAKAKSKPKSKKGKPAAEGFGSMLSGFPPIVGKKKKTFSLFGK